MKHFSKYGLQEENEDEMEVVPPTGGASGVPPSQPGGSRAFGALPPLSAAPSGPPPAVTALTTLPQFMSHMNAPSFTAKSVSEGWMHGEWTLVIVAAVKEWIWGVVQGLEHVLKNTRIQVWCTITIYEWWGICMSEPGNATGYFYCSTR